MQRCRLTLTHPYGHVPTLWQTLMVFFLLAGHRANPTPNGLGVSDSLIFPAHDLYQNHVYKPGCPGAYPPVLFTCLNTDYHLHCYPSACQSPPLLLPQSSYKKPLLVSNHIRYKIDRDETRAFSGWEDQGWWFWACRPYGPWQKPIECWIWWCHRHIRASDASDTSYQWLEIR